MAESPSIRRTVKIESDGSPHGTKVIDVATGHELRCLRVMFDHGHAELPVVELEIPLGTLEYTGLATIVLVDEFGDEVEVQKKRDK